MVLPAIHMTKEEVADLFSKEVNERLNSDIPRLVKVARRELRNRFLNADMGISGANIAVAETGSIVIVENEGNARLVTTLPNIHIVLVGLEKLVPKFSNISTDPYGITKGRHRTIAHKLHLHNHRTNAQYRWHA